MNLSYLLSLKDSVNQDTLSNSVIIKVNYDSLKFKLENNRNDTIIENFSLLLFDYDSPKISPSDKILLKAIASRIVDNAIVTIIGYTDSLGAEGYNKNLAISRAKETLKYLKILVPKNVIFSVDEINSGEFERFSYNSPEGRSHCRTVIIDVRIPIVRNKHNKK
jgi:flagellar motor protein MotB